MKNASLPLILCIRTMAKISHDDVVRIANLASISLTDEEIKKLQPELEQILEFVEQINKVDTEGVVPTAQVTSLEHVVREDKEQDYDVTPDELLDLPDQSENNQIKVPSVK